MRNSVRSRRFQSTVQILDGHYSSDKVVCGWRSESFPHSSTASSLRYSISEDPVIKLRLFEVDELALGLVVRDLAGGRELVELALANSQVAAGLIDSQWLPIALG